MTLYTIGYEGQCMAEFLAHLKFHKISMVIDVRSMPISRKKGFSKTALSVSLRDKQIAYLNLRGLGTTKEMRDQLKASGDFKRFSRQYLGELPEHSGDLTTILEYSSKEAGVALLCFERDPSSCHRSLVAQEVKKRDGNGLRIKHIIPAV